MTRPTLVNDPGDRALVDYAAIRDPDLARTRDVFIAEGRLVVRRLLASTRLTTRSVVVTPTAFRSIEDMLGERSGLPVYLVAQEVMNTIAGFNIHRGCLAVGERPPRVRWQNLVRNARRIVVLERVGDADNVGAIFRSAAAFDADAILLGPACADPLYRKAIRTSMGATLALPFAEAEPWPDVLRQLRDEGWAVAALTPAQDALPLRTWAHTARCDPAVMVLGHEGSGLSAEALTACSDRVRIPIQATVDSLNVGTAAAIALYELSCR